MKLSTAIRREWNKLLAARFMPPPEFAAAQRRRHEEVAALYRRGRTLTPKRPRGFAPVLVLAWTVAGCAFVAAALWRAACG